MKDILLDTGITRTLVHQKLILREKTSGEVIIHCAHGDEVSYSLAQVEIAVGGQVLAVEAGVSVLLGTNVPQLVNLLSGVKGGVEAREGMPDEALAVNTQAQTRRNVEETILREQRQLDSGVQHRDESGEDLEETEVSVEMDTMRHLKKCGGPLMGSRVQLAVDSLRRTESYTDDGLYLDGTLTP